MINLRLRVKRHRLLVIFCTVGSLNFSEVLKGKMETLISTSQNRPTRSRNRSKGAHIKKKKKKSVITLPQYPLPARHLHPRHLLLLGLWEEEMFSKYEESKESKVCHNMKGVLLTMLFQIGLQSGNEFSFVSLGVQASGLTLLPQFGKLKH